MSSVWGETREGERDIYVYGREMKVKKRSAGGKVKRKGINGKLIRLSSM